MSFKAHFSRFLEADPDRLHFAAHSHHLWPDVSFDAQLDCWNDAAALADRKWDKLFTTVYPAAQRRVARVLNLGEPAAIAFGPNTHGFVLRLMSCLPAGRRLEVLTTDSEFHSFERQVRRLEEDGLVRAERVPAEPFASFTERFADKAARGGHDLIYFSQVFYNSGYAVPGIEQIVAGVPDNDGLVVVDGYHGFLARPTDLAAVEGRACYLAGGYKYAMAGEGACFLHAPPGRALRPRDTGWYAAFEALEDEAPEDGEPGQTAYGPQGMRFLGATFDPVGLYRLNAVLAWLESLELDAGAIHARVLGLQSRFIEGLTRLDLEALHAGQLIVPVSEPNRGNFLGFRTADAGAIHQALLARKVITDHRADRLRFGFGLYHDEEDVDRLCRVLGEVLA